jgi:hypothetical protein
VTFGYGLGREEKRKEKTGEEGGSFSQTHILLTETDLALLAWAARSHYYNLQLSFLMFMGFMMNMNAQAQIASGCNNKDKRCEHGHGNCSTPYSSMMQNKYNILALRSPRSTST